MSLNQPEMVLLDLDGTLVDTVPDLTYCLNTMLRKLSMPEAGEAKARDWVDNGIERLAKKKPDPLPLLHAVEYLDVSPISSLMVGDLVNEDSAAHAAGFQVLCVSYGYNLDQDIRLARPDHVVDSLADLVDIFLADVFQVAA